MSGAEMQNSTQPLRPENALWIMAIVEHLGGELFGIAGHAEAEPTEAQKSSREEFQKRLEARMSQMNSSLDSLTKEIQAGIAVFAEEFPDGLPDKLGKMERRQPAEPHLTKLRAWVLENLTAIGLKPQAQKPRITTNHFILWLDELTGDEADVIFGAVNMESCRSGETAALDLRDELERVATCIATGSGDELLSFADELFDEDERIAPQNALRATMLIKAAMKMGLSPAFASEANAMLARIHEVNG